MGSHEVWTTLIRYPLNATWYKLLLLVNVQSYLDVFLFRNRNIPFR
jgi:hypothetical protein